MAKKTAPKKSTRRVAKPTRRASKLAARKAVKKVARKVKKTGKPKAPAKAVRKPLKTKAVKKAAAKPVRKPVRLAKPVKSKKVVKKVIKKTAPKPAAKAVTRAPKKPAAPPPPVRLHRERRRLPEADTEFTGTGGDARLLRSARSGHDELQSELRQHTEASPELTAGDVDAKWQDAYAVGDEAPGGDNMTPDQDRVDDIGKALGIEYDDDEELQGGAELTARDESRWELDPESKEDDEDE
jgi:hypothetical protein